MSGARVLVVDDSPFFREVLRDVLRAYPDIEVVGEAANGLQAQAQALALRPDVITMDVVMPMVGGLDAIKQVMAQSPTPIVVLASPGNDPERLALDAIAAGALDVFEKPVAGFSRERADEFAQLLRAAARTRARFGPELSRASSARVRARVRVGPCRCVGLVASTGGPRVLREVLAALPASFPVPIALVQHTVPGFAVALASWLDDATALRVRVARHGERLRPGEVVVAPDLAHLQIGPEGQARLVGSPPIAGHRPSGNVLLRSLAETYRAAALGVVLTGMGRDGADGLFEIDRAGGVTVVQDPDTAAIDGMPRAARARAEGAVELPPGELARFLRQRAEAAS